MPSEEAVQLAHDNRFVPERIFVRSREEGFLDRLTEICKLFRDCTQGDAEIKNVATLLAQEELEELSRYQDWIAVEIEAFSVWAKKFKRIVASHRASGELKKLMKINKRAYETWQNCNKILELYGDL